MQETELATPAEAKAKVEALFDSLALEYVREREQQFSFVSQQRIVMELLRGPRGITDAAKPCLPGALDRALAAAGLHKVESRACNFIFLPLREAHERASEALNRALTPLAATPIAPFLGAQYIVKAQKTAWHSASSG